MKLIDTIEMMSSPVYQERFRAEYMQLDIRIKALSNVIEKYNNGTLHFTPDCDIEMLIEQLVHMRNYRSILKQRAIIENINLEDL